MMTQIKVKGDQEKKKKEKMIFGSNQSQMKKNESEE